MPLLEQHVLGLDVPVYDPAPVGVVEGARHLPRDAGRVGDRQLRLALEPVAQRFAVDERHHVVEESVRLPGVENREDVRMGEPGGNLDLAQEALRADAAPELRSEHLDRHRPLVLHVLREEHGRHPSATELALDGVAVAEGGLDTRPEISHAGS